MAIVTAECPECGKLTPHRTEGTNEGDKVQKMECTECHKTWELKIESESDGDQS